MKKDYKLDKTNQTFVGLTIGEEMIDLNFPSDKNLCAFTYASLVSIRDDDLVDKKDETGFNYPKGAKLIIQTDFIEIGHQILTLHLNNSNSKVLIQTDKFENAKFKCEGGVIALTGFFENVDKANENELKESKKNVKPNLKMPRDKKSSEKLKTDNDNSQTSKSLKRHRTNLKTGKAKLTSSKIHRLESK